MAGADAVYPWGNSFDWLWTNGGRSRVEPALLPVGSVPEDESPFGILDLGGNVKEWCSDWHDKDADLRALRGSAFKDMDWSEFRSSYRDGDPFDETDLDLGFRIVRTLDVGK